MAKTSKTSGTSKTTVSTDAVALRHFLTKLAIDDKFRAAFNANKRKTLDDFEQPLSNASKDAIANRKSQVVLASLEIANENADPSEPKATEALTAQQTTEKTAAKRKR